MLSLLLIYLSLHTAYSSPPSVISVIRGVDPAFSSLFKGPEFACRDGSKKIPASRVNDDYCDCADGSDEPGTSACYYGRFYCMNRGHEPKSLSSSFVDDGVCDCCDGTDEKTGCRNSCLDQSAALRTAARGLVDQYAAALDNKAQSIASAHAHKAQLLSRVSTIHGDILTQQAIVKVLEAEKEKAQQEANARQYEAQAELSRQSAEQKRVDAAEKLKQADVPEGVVAPDSDSDSGDAATEESNEEIGRRIASQWIKDPESTGAHAEEHVSEGGEVDEGEEAGQEDGLDTNHYEDGDGSEEEEHTPTPDASESGDVHAVGLRLTAAQQTLRSLELAEAQIAQLSTSLDFGPGDMFLALFGRTIIAKQTRWSYEVTLYGSVVQADSANRVTVGNWQGFEHDYSEAVFANGEFCGAISAPRTFRLALRCGLVESVSEVAEGSTCAYSATLTTPLVCSEADVQAVRAELATLEALEADVLREIADSGGVPPKDEL
ncbi:MAG: hypothetical protein WDW36_002962 [Sanguina aurantia]